MRFPKGVGEENEGCVFFFFLSLSKKWHKDCLLQCLFFFLSIAGHVWNGALIMELAKEDQSGFC